MNRSAVSHRKRIFVLLLLVTLILCGVIAASHHHDVFHDRQGALLCPICLALAQQAATLHCVFLFLLFLVPCSFPTAEPEEPRKFNYFRSWQIRAPPA